MFVQVFSRQRRYLLVTCILHVKFNLNIIRNKSGWYSLYFLLVSYIQLAIALRFFTIFLEINFPILYMFKEAGVFLILFDKFFLWNLTYKMGKTWKRKCFFNFKISELFYQKYGLNNLIIHLKKMRRKISPIRLDKRSNTNK